MHRDLKPGNVLLSQDGTIKLTDFGLVRIKRGADELNTPSVITPGYRPPKIMLQSRSYNESVDIFSAGVFLAELSTKSQLFLVNTTVVHICSCRHISNQVFRVFSA